MNVRRKILIILLLGCALLAQSAFAATIVAASNAPSKDGAKYICDGNNDQIEINNALAGGGEVVLTAGTFYTSGTILCKAGTTLTGQGQEKTILSMAGDYAARVDIAQPNVKVQDLTITQRGWLMITTSHVIVEDVTIRDSKKTAPTVNGMFFVWADGKVCEDIAFTRCIAQDVGSTGFNLNGQRSPRENRNIRFESCKAIRCGNEGSGKIWAVGFDFHEGADLYDLSVNNCYAEDCWESGFYFEPNFYNGEDPNTALPVQVNSRVTNCVAVNNGWRNNLDTRFYMTGFYLSCGVTLTGCSSKNNRNNGFWVWQSAKDVILNSCTDDGSDKSFQVRTGSNLKFNDCISMNARTYALYAWGSDGVIFDDFRIINPKKSSGAISLGLREDHPNDPWPVTDCTFDILLTGANPDTLIRYYNAFNNRITINDDPQTPPTTIPTTVKTVTSVTTTTPPTVPVSTTPGTVPSAVGKGVIPGTIEAENYDAGGDGTGYHDYETDNLGGTYRDDGVDIEYSGSTDSYVVGWMRPAEWLQYTVNVTKAGTYNAEFHVASPNTGTTFTLAVDGTDKATYTVPNTGSFDAWTTVTKQVTLTAGKHVLRVKTTGYHNICCMKFSVPGTITTAPTTTVPTTTVSQGMGAAIPGLIEAENYNTGGEGIAYHDVEADNFGGEYRTDGVDIEMSSSEGSYVVGWVRPGEWLKYTVNVNKAGVYDASFRVSTPRSDASFKMQVDGADVCTVMAPNTGDYLAYTTVVQQVSLPAGSHVVRLYFNGYTNVNWMKFQTSTGGGVITTIPTTVTTTPSDTAVQGLPLPPPVPVVYGTGIVPGVVQAEDFNTGGEGVGYYDTTSSNFGGVYRTTEDVDIELSSSGTSPVVCWIRPGEWLKYTVNVRWTADYNVVFRVSSPQAGTQMRLQVDGVTATTFTVPNTGSYDTYTTVTQKVRLTGGPHVLRLVFGGYHNIDSMSFEAIGSPTSSRGIDAAADVNSTASMIPTPAIMPVATATAAVNVTTPAVAVTTANVTGTPTVPPANATTATTTAAPSNATPTATAEATNVTVTPTATTANGTATAPVTTVASTVAETTAATPAVPVTAAPTVDTTVPLTTLTATATATAAIPVVSTTPNVTGTPPVTATPTATPTEIATPTATPTVEPLIRIAEADQNLSTFVTAVEEAGLADTLRGVGPYTIFAPTNDAFDALPAGTLDALRANRTLLATVLSHHIARGVFTGANLTGVPGPRVLDGDSVLVTVRLDGRLAVNGSLVNQTDVLAANGVIHVIDKVILPADAIPAPTTLMPVTSTAIATPTMKATTVAPPDVPDATTAARTSNGTPAA